MSEFVPKIFTVLRHYDRAQFTADLIAGVIVGIVAIPLAIAFAIASGVSPDRGLYTAIVAGFLVSALGGSRVLIGGPTGAFVVIVYGIVQKYGIDGLTVATLMAGVILVIMGVTRLGGAIKFIPHPVVIGFTSGIAVVIFSSEVKDFLGLQMGAVPADFLHKWAAFARHLGTAEPTTVVVGLLSLVVIIVWPRVNRRIPGAFVALILATVAVQLFHLPVETIGSRFGGITASLPHPSLPHLTLAQVQGLVAPAFTIAILAAVESLLAAVVSDGMIGGHHRSNMELVAQGVANIAAPLFGGMPATGAIARTATSIKNGGRTPVAGIVHAVTLLLITLAFGKWAALVPLPTLAAILVIVAYHMSEWRTFRAELRAPKSDAAVLLTTFGLTVLVDLTVAIGVGMVLAAFLFMKRMSEVTSIHAVTREFIDSDTDADDDLADAARLATPGVQTYEINGPFFFGAAERFKETLSVISAPPRVLILRMRHVTAMDSSGMHALRHVVQKARADGTLVLLSGVHMQPLVALERSGLIEDIGRDSMFATVDEAMARARAHLGLAAPAQR
ncbi:MAG: SulP family inorganic anion transporter [Gemmatimonadaceae bacterium]